MIAELAVEQDKDVCNLYIIGGVVNDSILLQIHFSQLSPMQISCNYASFVAEATLDVHIIKHKFEFSPCIGREIAQNYFNTTSACFI